MLLAQFQSAAASVVEPEATAEIIAAQLHRQGVACTAPRDPARDDAASIPHESVWTVRCDEALYRVRLIPRRRAEITPISHPAPESSSERRDAPNSPCG
jgi:hypothetical protein